MTRRRTRPSGRGPRSPAPHPRPAVGEAAECQSGPNRCPHPGSGRPSPSGGDRCPGYRTPRDRGKRVPTRAKRLHLRERPQNDERFPWTRPTPLGLPVVAVHRACPQTIQALDVRGQAAKSGTDARRALPPNAAVRPGNSFRAETARAGLDLHGPRHPEPAPVTWLSASWSGSATAFFARLLRRERPSRPRLPAGSTLSERNSLAGAHRWRTSNSSPRRPGTTPSRGHPRPGQLRARSIAHRDLTRSLHCGRA